MIYPFTTAENSFKHSSEQLALLNNYASFMDSINSVVDLGCGAGMDAHWWATATTNDDEKRPQNYNVVAVDCDPVEAKYTRKRLQDCANATVVHADFHSADFLREYKDTFDVAWAHDVLQYSVNPLQTLASWNSIMQHNAMLYIAVPQAVNNRYNRLSAQCYSRCFHYYSVSNLVYMLVCQGFDCSDARFNKEAHSELLQVACYKVAEPMLVGQTMHAPSWYELLETNRLPSHMHDAIEKTGYIDDVYVKGTWFNGRKILFGNQ